MCKALIHFNDKVHCRDSCCQTGATFYRQKLTSSSLFASVCRTLSPLEPDVPKIPNFWLSVHWDSHHRINENIREWEEKEARSCSLRLQRFCIFCLKSSLISDFFSKIFILLLIEPSSLHLFSYSGPDVTLSWSEKVTWHFSFCLVFGNELWSHMAKSGNIKHQHWEGNTKAKDVNFYCSKLQNWSYYF